MANSKTANYDVLKLSLDGGDNTLTVKSSAPNQYKLTDSEFSEALTVEAGDYDFSKLMDGTWAISNRGSVIGSDIVIPSKHEGQAVTRIGWRAFDGHTALTKITIPTSITHIDREAFRGCTSLEEIVFGDILDQKVIFFERPSEEWGTPSVWYYYGNGATNHDTGTAMDIVDAYNNIYSCTVPSDIYLIEFRSENRSERTSSLTIGEGEITNHIFRAPKQVLWNGTVSYPLLMGGFYDPGTDFVKYNGLKIGKNAFEGCTKLAELTLPRRTVSMGDYAFKNCGYMDGDLPMGLAKVNLQIGHRLLNIGSAAFLGCVALTNVTLKEGVRSIGTFAFSGCPYLENCNLPEGLEEIHSNAFENCNILQEVYIPASVKLIAPYAFAMEENLTLPQGRYDRWVQFANPYTWVLNTVLTIPKDGKNTTVLNPTDLYTEEIDTNQATRIGDLLSYDHTKFYWHKLDKMLPPIIELDGYSLSMTDPLGIAEQFKIYINGAWKATINADTSKPI